MKILNPKTVFILIVAAITSTSVFAQSRGGQTSGHSSLEVGGGISMPATSSAVLSNPAGMVGAHTALVVHAAASEVWDNGTYRGGLQTGGSSYGVAAGVENNSRGSGSSSTNAYYGFAVGSHEFSLGVAGKTGVSNSSGSTFNAGILVGVIPMVQLGFTAMSLNGGVDEWGFGAAFKFGNGIALVLDGAASSGFKKIEMKPAIKVGEGPAALTIGYATGARQEFNDGFAAGGSYQFANCSLEVQYNAGGAYSKYFAGLTIGI
jgi:hypothetical protein